MNTLPRRAGYLLLAISSWWLATAGAAQLAMAQGNDENILAETAASLRINHDLAQYSPDDLSRELTDMLRGFPRAQSATDRTINEYVQDVLVCVNNLAGADFGSRDAQDALCQRMVLGCLHFADQLDVSTEMSLVTQMRPNRNAKGEVVQGAQLSALRSRLLEYRLHLLRRFDGEIDPNWDPKDVPLRYVPTPSFNYEPGTPPEEIKDPDAREKYAKAIEENHMKAEKYGRQRAMLLLRGHYLKELKDRIANDYQQGPTTDDDLEVLHAYLRIYVVDPKLRKELFDLAQGAATQK